MHELPQVNGSPFRSPLIDTSNPWGSLAVNSKDSSPLHHPESPQRSQTTCPVISGGKGVGVGEGVFVGVEVGVKVGVGVLVEVGICVGVLVANGVIVANGVEVLAGVGGG